jgi:predicted RNA binding protein YcfA (HicA-like mRNA interferase family)
VGRIPPLRPRIVIAILTGLGFVEVRQRGSHKQFRHPDGRATTVPDHGGRDVAPALIRIIARDIGLSAEDFVDRR